MKDFLCAEMSQIEGKIVGHFFHIFTHYFVDFNRDRRLRTFLKIVQKYLQHTCLNEGGGGGKGFLTNV